MKHTTHRRLLSRDAIVAAALAFPQVVVGAPAAPGGGAGAWTSFNEEVPSWVTFAPNGMPILHSSPSSKAQVYLDFDGDPNRIGDDGNPVRAIDFDGDPTTFNAYEQQYIYNWWLSTSAMYSMFDIDVTTEVDLNDPRSWNLVSPSWNGGEAGFGSFGMTEGTSVISTGFGPYSTVIGHEGGHTFGLPHAINWDKYGDLTEAYYGNPDNLRAAVMGSADNVQNKWYNKNHWGYDDTIFDDISRVMSTVQSHVPASPGCRPDDHADALGSAAALTAQGTGFRGEGVIEQMSDVDMFSFTWAGGRMSLHTAAVEISPVCLKVSLLDSNGDVIAHVDNGKNIQWLQDDLAAGTYYLKLESAGRYSDLGSYRIYVDATPNDWYAQNVGNVRLARENYYDSATGEWSLDVASRDVWGAGDSFMFTYQRLDGDGEIIAHLKSQEYIDNAWTKSGVMIRESLDHDSKHVFALSSSSNGTRVQYRSATSGSSSDVNGGNSNKWLRLVRSGDTISSYASADGTNWTLMNSQSIPMAQQVYIGLANCSNNHTRAVTAIFDNVTVTGTLVNEDPATNSLSVPAVVNVTSSTHDSVDLSWDSVSGATGYTIEKSMNGVDFVSAGIVASGTTSYQVTGLDDGRLHFFRIRANDGNTVSAASVAVESTTRPGPVRDLRLISLSTTTIVLDWEEPFGETGYRIERSLDGVNYTTVGNAVQHGRKFVDSWAFSGLRYYYRVVTLDENGDSASIVIRRDEDPLIDDDGSTGIMPWAREIEYGTPALVKQGSIAGNRTKAVDLSAINGDASYEFLVEAIDTGQTSVNLLEGNGFALKFEQWNDRNEFGVTQFGAADWSFTAVNGQSVASPYGSVQHVVFTVDTALNETRLYVDGVHVGSFSQAVELGGGTATLGQSNMRSDGATGIHAFAAYNSILSVSEMLARKNAWFTGVNTNQAPTASDVVFSVTENSLAGTVVGSVVAMDPDQGQVLSYAFTAGNSGGEFSINASTGEITTATSLNYESTSQYVLTVEVSDNGNPALSDVAEIFVNVTNVNEAPNAADGSGSVAENASAGAIVATVGTSDPDAGDVLNYEITSGNTGGAFSINGTGEIATTMPLNYEELSSYSLTIAVTDAGGLSDTATITVSVTDLNESTLTGVQAWEEAVHQGSAFVHKRISPLSGNTTTTVDLSAISGSAAYEFVVDAQDLGRAAVHLLDGNGWSLRFEQWNNTNKLGVTKYGDSDYLLTPESGQSVDSPYGTVHHIVYVVDVVNIKTSVFVDGVLVGTANQVPELNIASIVLGDTNMRSDASTGIHVFAAYDDVLAGSEIAAHYQAWSGQTPNSAPVIADQSFSIAENSTIGTVVGTIVAADPDQGQSLSYAITAGNTGGEFTVNSGTGEITTTTALDYEKNSQYVLSVEVTDAGLLSDTASITVNVNDVNEAPVANDHSGSVSEDAVAGMTVVTVTSSDVDAGDSASYAITGGNVGGSFSIDSATGEITTAVALDYEITTAYLLTVSVTDGGGLTDYALVDITVNDVADQVTSYSSDAELVVLGAQISGSYLDTQASNNVYEVLQEEKTSGKPNTRVSSLEHTWSFDIGTAGALVELSVEAFHSANNEGDDFVFGYSTDGIVFTDVITVTKTSDDNTAQVAMLPAGISGTVYIRVMDTDRTVGSGSQDSISIDQLKLEVTR
ncbi:hypothetical protein Rhal01_03595 [Rubritalea halochordaticola]|uniref:Staphylococcus aureus surface protein A n=1 Tax=Rubritalea halochordaticola TaxID=714537 RepID=A0ABP9V406_9BACT